MSRSVNIVILMGNLARDAETRYTQNGTAVVNLSIATNYQVKKDNGWEDKVDFHNIVAWRAENVAQYLTKGTQVHVTGRLQTRSYEDQGGNRKYVTEVIVNSQDIVLCGGGNERAESTPKLAAAPTQTSIVDDDDVPF